MPFSFRLFCCALLRSPVFAGVAVGPVLYVLEGVQLLRVHLKLGNKQSVVGEGEVRWPHLVMKEEERGN